MFNSKILSMKLAAIYNVWDGVELLRGSMESVKDGVDLFIIVYQNVSNIGEVFHPLALLRYYREIYFYSPGALHCVPSVSGPISTMQRDRTQ